MMMIIIIVKMRKKPRKTSTRVTHLIMTETPVVARLKK
jgi:hypothetical protein